MKGIIVRAVVLAAALFLVCLFIIDWNALVWEGSRRETNDAQLRGSPTRLSARVGGYVTAVPVTDNQFVRAGDLLYQIEDDDFTARVARAEADVAQADANVALAGAQVATTRADIGVSAAATQADAARLTRARLERVRQAELLGTESSLPRAYDAAASDERREGAMLTGDQSAVGAATAQTGVARAQVDQSRASLRAAQAALDLARAELSYTRIVAPRDGVVATRLVRLGALVSPGMPLITLVPLDDIWAVATYREEQLSAMRAGQPAEIRVDAFPGTVLHGHVDSIDPGSEARAAGLPPDRAVGNFTKIIQRVPVKIVFDPGPLAGRLIPGLSVETIVDTAAAAPARAP